MQLGIMGFRMWLVKQTVEKLIMIFYIMKLAKVECTCMQMLLIIFMFYYEKIGNQFLLLLLGRQTMWQTHLRDGVPLYPQRFNHGLSTHWDFSFSSF